MSQICANKATLELKSCKPIINQENEKKIKSDTLN